MQRNLASSPRQRGCRSHRAERGCAITSAELAEPENAAEDQLVLSLSDLGPVHRTSESIQGVHALPGLLPEEFRKGVTNLRRSRCHPACRFVKIFSDISRALSDLDALARNIGARLGSFPGNPCQLFIAALGRGALLLVPAFKMGDLVIGASLGSGESTCRGT